MSIKTVITDGGLELLRAAPNHTLIYTRAVCGSGFAAGTQLAELTNVVDYVMDLSIVEVKPTETAATLRLQLDNSKAPKEFHLYQIGVLAKLMDGDNEIIGERLLHVMQYDEPDIVRAVPHVSEYVVNTLMGQADTVEGIIDLAAYVSVRHFQDAIATLDDVNINQNASISALSSDLAQTNAQLSNKANKGTSQFINLVAAGSFNSTSSYYCKNDMSEVEVNIAIEKPEGTAMPNNSLLATLPVGFRPPNQVRPVAVFHDDSTGNATSILVQVGNNGQIRAWAGNIPAAPRGVVYMLFSFNAQ